MNKQRKKCEHLKEIRKKVADAIGVELNQGVCTYEGECKGTCPKCEQEEQKLSKALLVKGTTVAASAAIMLTGCTKPIEPNATVGLLPSGVEYQEELEGGRSIYTGRNRIVKYKKRGHINLIRSL